MKKNRYIVGITGGIATGKSTAASFFQAKDYPVIDADKLGHEIIERSHVKQKLRQKFGNGILNNTKIDREKLGKLVFNDPGKLQLLNSVVHPVLIAEIKKQVNSLDCEIIFIDAALILEWGMDEFCDSVILIVANKEIQIDRLKKYRNYNTDKAKSRISAQHFLPEKADFIISNNSTLSQFNTKLFRVLKKFIEKASC